MPSPTRARSIFGVTSTTSPMQAAGMATNVRSVIPRRLLRPRTVRNTESFRTHKQSSVLDTNGQDLAPGRIAHSSQPPRQQKQRRKPRLRRRQSRRPSPKLQPRRPQSPRLSLLHLQFVCAEHGIHQRLLFGRGPRTLLMTSQNALLLIAMWTPAVRQMMRYLVRFCRPKKSRSRRQVSFAKDVKFQPTKPRKSYKEREHEVVKSMWMQW